MKFSQMAITAELVFDDNGLIASYGDLWIRVT